MTKMLKSLTAALAAAFAFYSLKAEDAADIVSTAFDWGFSNVVQTAEGKTEYVLAYTDTTKEHTFIVPEGVYSLQYLVVAGGGGGGGYHGGGGGGGGVLANDAFSVTPGNTLMITVGAGGAGGGNLKLGSNGGNSSIVYGGTTVQAIGGGGGGTPNASNPDDRHGLPGGSGGGAGGVVKATSSSSIRPAANGGSGTPGQGCDGGSRGSYGGSNVRGCGGGGAGAAGTADGGGAGIASSITGRETYYAGGGGGGAIIGGTGTDGGAGGGGKGGSSGGAVAGTASTGGGGGGGYYQKAGAAGGSGIVIIRYAVLDSSNGLIVSAAGGSYGSPNPAYGTYETMPDVTEYTCDEYVETAEEGVRAYCTGWTLYDSNNVVVRSSENPNSGETALKAILDSSAAGGELEWQWELRYALTLSCRPSEDGSIDNLEGLEGYYGAGTNVTITATPNKNCFFEKWVVDGAENNNKEQTLTITFEDKPISVEAVFTADGITVNYGDVAESVEGYDETKNYTLNTVGSAYTLTCPKYVVVEENARRKSCIGYTLALLPDGEETMYEITDAGDFVTATVPYSAPVRLTWKWTDEYYVATVAMGRGSLKEDKSRWCRTGDVVSDIEIVSTDNFLGWGGFGTGKDRSGTSVSVTVADKPITVTAYFTKTDKDNLVLNGDFEMNSNSSHWNEGLGNFNRLNAGSWIVERYLTGNYISGLIAANNGQSHASNLWTIDKLSSELASTASQQESIKCDVYVPCQGIYRFKCEYLPAGGNYLADTWELEAVLENKANGKIVTIGSFYVERVSARKYISGDVQFSIPKGGSYTLKLYIPSDSISGDGTACMAVDNISLKLEKKTGAFTVIIR